MKQNCDTRNLIGIYPAMLTPFTASGVDVDAAAAHVGRLLDEGADGAYICGSSGEMLSMSLAERKALIEAAVGAARGRGKIIVHIGCTDLRDAVVLAAYAADCGAAALAAIPPIYYRVPFAWIKDWIAALAAETDLPLLYYNIPSSTGVTLDDRQLKEILEIDGVSGMKFTACDFFALNRVAAAHPDYALYNGQDEMLLAGIVSGANGYIGTSGNIMCCAVRCLMESVRTGNIQLAQAIQTRMNDIITASTPYGVIAAFKVIAGLGDPRAPQKILDAAEKAAVERDIRPMVDALNADCRKALSQI